MLRKVNMPLAEITLDPRLQCRASTDETTINEYAEHLQADGKFDGLPPQVFADDNGTNYLADGFQRYHAHVKAGKKAMPVELHTGGYAAALRFAVGANANHGKRRTAMDKQRAIAACFQDAVLRQCSNREIAELCRVSRGLVNAARERAEAEETARTGKPAPERRYGSDGKSHPVSKSTGREKDEEATEETPAEETAAAAPMPESKPLMDAEETVVPDNLIHLFSHRDQLSQIIEILEVATTATRLPAALARLGRLDAAYSGFVQPSKSVDLVTDALKKLENALSFLEANSPYVVCPACAGDGCEHCRRMGWMPEWRHKEWKKAPR